MAESAPLKVLVVGPSRSRKSHIASFLAGTRADVGGDPAGPPGPTVGVRILELEREGARVQLWDVSGDQSYETTWPAIQKGAEGVILVYAPENAGASKEVQLWHSWFVERKGIPAVCFCMVSAAGQGSPPSIGTTPLELLSFDNPDAISEAFESFMSRVAAVSRR